MKTAKKISKLATVHDWQSLTLGDFAHSVLAEQFQPILKLEKKVLADKDSENLHQMRVSMRRLRTALQVFDQALELPKAAHVKRVGAIAQKLGYLRDLDVQIADLQDVYRPQINDTEQALLDQAIADLYKERNQAFKAVEHTLTRSRYQKLKTAYRTWLTKPHYTPVAQLPLQLLLPDLLSPLLAELLLHPGWLIQADADNETLHDLRKTCKRARYQAEFFKAFYDKSFQAWISEIKTIQDKLGKVQDSQVLLHLLAQQLPGRAKLPQLHASIRQMQAEMMESWEPIRQKYLEPAFRQHLHEMLLDYPKWTELAI